MIAGGLAAHVAGGDRNLYDAILSKRNSLFSLPMHMVTDLTGSTPLQPDKLYVVQKWTTFGLGH